MLDHLGIEVSDFPRSKAFTQRFWRRSESRS
jgi:hypothetical protein